MTCFHCEQRLTHWHCSVCGAAREENVVCSRCRSLRDNWLAVIVVVLGMFGWGAVIYLIGM